MSHTATGEWKSFEIRMRRRRAERLVLRADVAVTDGCLEEARAALDEARALWSAVPGLDDVQQRIDAAATAAEAPATPSKWKEQVAAGIAVAFASGALALLLLMERNATGPASRLTALRVRNMTSIVDAIPTIDPVRAVTSKVLPTESFALPGAVPELPDPDADTQSPTVTPRTPVDAPAPRMIAADSPTVAADPRTVAADSRTVAADPATVAAVTRTAVGGPAAGVPDPQPRATDVPSVPVPDVAAPPAATPTVLAVSDPAPVQPPQEPLIRSALARYAKAYTELDVDAAERVWPSVNRSALARAFDRLQAQRVSLGACRIEVDGNAAHASCAGAATWTPKVGGGERTDARRWNFDLEKSGAGWQIVNARVQNR